jgi:hypothetical protein
MAKGKDTVGNEIPKEYRAIATELRTNQGWGYQKGNGHPKLYPANGSRPIPVPTTPGDHRSLPNCIAQVRRGGGIWPVGR